MIALLVLVLMLMGLISVAGYNALSVQLEAAQLMKATAENRRLDQWVALLQANARAIGPGGSLALPLGEDHVENGAEYHGLPAWISLDRQNPWGRALRYCPFAAATATGSTLSIPAGNDQSYDVSVTEYAGHDYVTGSAPAPLEGVLGIILSPLPNAAEVSCADVTYSNGAYRVPGRAALVRTIAVANVAHQVEESAVIVNLTAENVTEHNQIINETLAAWNVRQPERTVIRLANSASAYEWPDLSFLSSEPGNTRTIQIIGESRAGVTIDGSAETFRRLELSGVDLFIENVTFSERVGLNLSHGRMETRNVTLGQTALRDATWRLTGSSAVRGARSSDTNNVVALQLEETAVHQDGHALTVESLSGSQILIEHLGGRWSAKPGARLSLRSSSAFVGARLRNGVGWYFDGAGIDFDDGPPNTLKVSGLLIVTPGCEARLQNVDVELAAEAHSVFNVSGTLALVNTTVDLTRGADRGIYMRDEASVTLSSGTRLGANAGSTSKPATGIDNTGGRFIAGSGAVIHSAHQCWTGPLFASVSSPFSGTSIPVDPNHLTFNQSNWTCISDES